MSQIASTTVAVIGSGNMGHGIAQVAAMSGCTVVLQDIEEELVQDGYEAVEWSLDKLAERSALNKPVKTVLDRIQTEVNLAAAVESADFVIEAVPERMELKRDVLGELDAAAPEDAILASNTSSLSITEIGAATDRPEQVIGTHFFNPPVKMDLIEVVYGDRTSEETIDRTLSFIESIGKMPIEVRKDVRGFVVNNVLLPFMMEAAWMLSNDETTIREADAAMVHQRGYPMGPFELADLTGLDIGYDVYEEGGRPIPPVLAAKVKQDDLGQKTGQGYYDYENGGADYEEGDVEGFDTLRIEARMINAAADLVGNNVATPEDVDIGMRLGAGFPEGVCERSDKIGLEVVLEKLTSLWEETGQERYEPSQRLEEYVERGHTGIEAGRGFFEY